MKIYSNKLASLLAVVVAATVLQTVQAEETCHDVWAYESEHDICIEQMGASYWGWTNGRFGTSNCDACNCPVCPGPTPAPTPVPVAVTLPQQCSGISASWSGDPHFKTFDGLKYDCQGEGEFHVLKSLDSKLEIQGRFVKFRDNKRPTVTKALTFNTGDGDPLLQVSVPDTPVGGSCMPYIHVDKVQVVDALANDFVAPGIQVAYDETKRTKGYIIYYHQSGVQATIHGKKSSANGCVMSAKFCFPDDWDRSREEFVGLLGPQPDGDKSNDWMDWQNTPVPVPTNRKDLRFDKSYDYCVDNWCIRDEAKSNFVYESGESHAGFNQCGLPADIETRICVESPADDLAAICGADLGCLVDGCVGGVEEAKDFLAVEAATLEGSCTREVHRENFQGASANDWGETQEGTNTDGKFLALHTGSRLGGKTITYLPRDADTIELTFKFLEIGDWEASGTSRDHIYVKVGATELDLLGFDKDYIEGNRQEYFEGFKNGVAWSRKALTEPVLDLGFSASRGKDQIHEVTVKIPQSFYEDGSLKLEFEVDMSASMGNEWGGVEDLKLTAVGQAMCRPLEMRSRRLQETDSCSCVCPALPGVSPSGTNDPAAPKVMDLYYSADEITCDPAGEKVGTVTMQVTTDGSVTFNYNVDQKYTLKETSVYVGEDRLPSGVNGYLTEDEFPSTMTASGQTASVTVDPLGCDYYAAAHAKVCGEFPSAPTPAPTPSVGGANGDPHIKTWDAETFDFHGGCDLVLVKNTGFLNGLGLDINIRTKIRDWWSYIDSAVLRIGNDTFELHGGINTASFWINGKAGEVTKTKGYIEVGSLAGYKIEYMNVSKRQKNFRLKLSVDDSINLQTFNDFVRVDVKAKSDSFNGSVGLMGKFPSGDKLDREGNVMVDTDDFGKEWQVQSTEPMLFHSVEGPQHPTVCAMPPPVSAAEKGRRLGEALITEDDAALACARVDEKDRDNCIFDVLATNSKDMAGSY